MEALTSITNYAARGRFRLYILTMIVFAFFVKILWISFFTQSSNAVDLWCGKAYREGDPLIIPGGAIPEPTISTVLLIDVSIRPCMSFYLDGEDEASFIVDAKASYIHGQPYGSSGQALNDQDEHHAASKSTNIQGLKDVLQVKIINAENGEPIIPQAAIAFNGTGREYSISMTTFKSRETPWPVTLELTKRDGTKFTATTQLNYLAQPQGPQSMTRIDSLRGGLQVRSDTPQWEPFFPYSFYLGGPWLESSPDNMKKFKDLGYNILHIIPGADGIGYDLDQLDNWFDEAEQLGLWIMFDMRWTYMNRQYVQIQVERYRSRKNMLLWYTADEPDGREDSPDAPGNIYPFIKSLDPYHPISLCLNCQNYFFQEYTAGTDIIMTSTYPVGANTEYSTIYNTPVNATYGDCGCDNCDNSPTSTPLSNIPSRMDLYARFQEQLGLVPKPIWSVPQAFTAQSFWSRTPTPEEVIAMTMLSINHGTTGIVMWAWPTSDPIMEATSKFSALVTSPEIVRFLLEGLREAVGVDGNGKGVLDARAWRFYDRLLVSVVNMADEPVTGLVTIDLPNDVKVESVGRMLWGGGNWKAQGLRTVERNGMGVAESSLFVVVLDN